MKITVVLERYPLSGFDLGPGFRQELETSPRFQLLNKAGNGE